MVKKVVFGLLILWGFVSQGFCTSSEENENSSDIHIRKKRLVGHLSHVRDAPFLVSLVANARNHCPATLISETVAITSAECLRAPNPTVWQIEAGTSLHQVLNVVQYKTYNSSKPTINNLALAFFGPRINYAITHNRRISIYSGVVAEEHNYPLAYNFNHEMTGGLRKQSATDVQKVILQLINYNYCRDYYRNKVFPGNICTQSTIPRQFLEHMDSGAPLVLENELLGIFVYRGQSRATDPDVFMNLLDDDIRHWIHRYVPNLNLF